MRGFPQNALVLRSALLILSDHTPVLRGASLQGIVLVVVLLGLSPIARAAGDLEQAEKQFAALDYKAAIATAKAVVQHGGNTPNTLARAYALLGQALAGINQEKEAERYFKLLLAVNPGFHLDAAISPKIQKPLENARAAWGGQPAITVIHHPPESGRVDESLVIKVSVVQDPMHLVRGASVTYRLPGVEGASTIAVANTGRQMVIAIPVAAVGAKPGRLSYHIDILDENKNALVRKGDSSHPLVVILAASSRPLRVSSSHAMMGPAWYARWWVWAIAGAVVVGAATTAVVVAAQPSESDVTLGWEVLP
ncbi:MAG: tetratricopeptide repeat protein [Deltaproteobacteria bacterium]|nr:tetratricopeptide repeat protein [Deltaproteobacteria bacterium]